MIIKRRSWLLWGCCGHVVVRRLRGKVRFMSWRTFLLYYNFPLCLRAVLPIPLGAVLVGPTASYSPRCELLHLLEAEAYQIEWWASAAYEVRVSIRVGAVHVGLHLVVIDPCLLQVGLAVLTDQKNQAQHIEIEKGYLVATAILSHWEQVRAGLRHFAVSVHELHH